MTSAINGSVNKWKIITGDIRTVDGEGETMSIKIVAPDGSSMSPEDLALTLRQALIRLSAVASTNIDGLDQDILEAEQSIRNARAKLKAALPDISKCKPLE